MDARRKRAQRAALAVQTDAQRAAWPAPIGPPFEVQLRFDLPRRPR